MTTYASFVSGLESLSVSGVKRTFTNGPPLSLNTADLPALWVELPAGEEGALSFDGGTWPALRATMVVVLEPLGQGRQPDNVKATIAMMDALAAALKSADVCQSRLRWSMRLMVVEVAGNAYWGIVCEVEGHG